MNVNTKEELRKKLSESISALPETYITESDRGLFLRITSMIEFIAARNIFMYYSVKREPATLEIAKIALYMGKTVAFPLCDRGGMMQARAVKSLDELKPAILGIPAPSDAAPVIAPEDLELIIVPALTYDFKGYRIGYGGGYYDRYLHGLPAFTVGITRERLILGCDLPNEPHDVAVKCIATENIVFRTLHKHI